MSNNANTNYEDYVNNEISTYMTNKNVLAFSDKMNSASPMNYATLHSKGEEGANGRKVYSTIGILALDFSNGKGSNTVRAEANVSPAEARYIFARVQSGMGHLDDTIFQSSKIFGQPDQYGYATMRNLKISRQRADSDGKVKKYPWIVAIDNGRAIKQMGQNGSSYAKSGTYQSLKKVMVNLSDQDMFCLLAEVAAFIQVWELTFTPKVVKEGRALLEQKMAEAAAEAERNPKPNPQQSHQMPQQNYQAPQQNQPAPSVPPAQGGQVMSLEAAREVLVNFGTKNGMTMGQIETEWVDGVKWYLTANRASPLQRQAAQVIINFHNGQRQAG